MSGQNGVAQEASLERDSQLLMPMSLGGPTHNYIGSLTISPLANQDDGTYICTGTVTGGRYVQQATASDNYSIHTIRKLLKTLFSFASIACKIAI